ncbi:hypothetical protein M5K25_007769 [Dendrobium thyrsiflorum]|uniref:Uncharacterized protein n=1 Tax=Dendrobium thyrsiflorum TaxID=117978 RepID=A0ABD0VEX9_DENTH
MPPPAVATAAGSAGWAAYAILGPIFRPNKPNRTFLGSPGPFFNVPDSISTLLKSFETPIHKIEFQITRKILQIKLSVSKIQTQQHQIRLNPSPNESKSRTRSAVGRFKPQFELPNGTQVRRRKREEKKKKKRREEGKEGRNSSSTTAGFRSDAGILSEFQITPEFCPTSKKGRNSAQLLRDTRILSNSQVTPEFSPTPKDLISAVHSNHSKNTLDLSLIYEPCHSQKSINRALILLEKGPNDAGILSEFQITPEFCPTFKKGRNSAQLLRDTRILSNSQVMPEFSPTPK